VCTDGACAGNSGPGGWTWAAPQGPYASGAAGQTTNQRLKITAVLKAVKTLDGLLEVVSDSRYVINCFRDRWCETWLHKRWLNSQWKPVANPDLWKPLIEIVQCPSHRVRLGEGQGAAASPSP
jgi:ribonuclease HI